MTERRASYHASEYEEQCALFAWSALQCEVYPPLRLMFATLNGAAMHPATAAKMRRAGMVKGVPDVWLPWPVGDYAGLVFEMKVGRNTCTDEQKYFLSTLADCGWRTGVCYSADDAIRLVVDYLEGR